MPIHITDDPLICVMGTGVALEHFNLLKRYDRTKEILGL